MSRVVFAEALSSIWLHCTALAPIATHHIPQSPIIIYESVADSWLNSRDTQPRTWRIVHRTGAIRFDAIPALKCSNPIKCNTSCAYNDNRDDGGGDDVRPCAIRCRQSEVLSFRRCHILCACRERERELQGIYYNGSMFVLAPDENQLFSLHWHTHIAIVKSSTQSRSRTRYIKYISCSGIDIDTYELILIINSVSSARAMERCERLLLPFTDELQSRSPCEYEYASQVATQRPHHIISLFHMKVFWLVWRNSRSRRCQPDDWGRIVVWPPGHPKITVYTFAL